MTKVLVPVLAVGLAAAVVCGACGGSSRNSGFDQDPGDGGDGPVTPLLEAGSFGDAATSSGGDSGTMAATTVVYANTDDSLYSMDPATKQVTLIGAFSGGGSDDGQITDVAVDAEGNVWVNSPTVVYRAALPAGGSGSVVLTKVATIAAASGQRFYALAFAPIGVLGAGETLVGGDGNGELWAIDTTSGATTDLGGFGADGTRAFALSGDIVFYLDSANKPTGLATIRSCETGGTNCTTTNDYLVGIDMTALATAFTTKTPAATLLGGIYGGSSTDKGAGTGTGDLFGLGAWEGEVFGFHRPTAASKSPSLIAIDTTTGAGSVVNSSFSFTNGWSGAGVTTKVMVTVPPPPAAPH